MLDHRHGRAAELPLCPADAGSVCCDIRERAAAQQHVGFRSGRPARALLPGAVAEPPPVGRPPPVRRGAGAEPRRRPAAGGRRSLFRRGERARDEALPRDHLNRPWMPGTCSINHHSLLVRRTGKQIMAASALTRRF